MDEHVHKDNHELILVLHGSILTQIRGQTLHGQRNDVLFYPRGEPHTEQAVGDEPLETLFMGWRWRPGNDVLSNAWPLMVNDRNGRINMLMQWMRELYFSNQSKENQRVYLLLDALLSEFEHLAQPPEHLLIEQAKAYIQHHLAEPISLDQIASQVGLSKYHFSHMFKRLTNQTPMTFLRHERVEAARSLLLSTPWSLQAIASQVGLVDEYHLSRVFRRVTGIAPSQLRRGG